MIDSYYKMRGLDQGGRPAAGFADDLRLA